MRNMFLLLCDIGILPVFEIYLLLFLQCHTSIFCTHFEGAHKVSLPFSE